MFNSGVLPILEYGAGIWGFEKAPDIKGVQNRAMRYFLGVHKYAALAGITVDLGWLRPKYGRYICALRLWINI